MYKRGKFGFFALHSELVSGLKACTFKTKNIMKKNSEVKKKWVTIRMNQSEYDRLQAIYKKSTCRGLSEYLRKIALQKPITIRYRNESADEILAGLLKIKKELNAIGSNFNQAVHKLHMLDRIPEFRTWLNSYEMTRQIIEEKYREILERMIQIHQRCSQK